VPSFTAIDFASRGPIPAREDWNTNGEASAQLRPNHPQAGRASRWRALGLRHEGQTLRKLPSQGAHKVSVASRPTPSRRKSWPSIDGNFPLSTARGDPGPAGLCGGHISRLLGVKKPILRPFAWGSNAGALHGRAPPQDQGSAIAGRQPSGSKDHAHGKWRHLAEHGFAVWIRKDWTKRKWAGSDPYQPDDCFKRGRPAHRTPVSHPCNIIPKPRPEAQGLPLPCFEEFFDQIRSTASGVKRLPGRPRLPGAEAGPSPAPTAAR